MADGREFPRYARVLVAVDGSAAALVFGGATAIEAVAA